MIAAEVHQGSPSSSDLSFRLTAEATGDGLTDPEPPPGPVPATLVAKGAAWRYRDTGSAPPADWTAPDFDDGAWQPVTLPHDWAIAGPFIQTGDVGGMGRLPSWGIGWYRRKLDVPAKAT